MCWGQTQRARRARLVEERHDNKLPRCILRIMCLGAMFWRYLVLMQTCACGLQLLHSLCGLQRWCFVCDTKICIFWRVKRRRTSWDVAGAVSSHGLRCTSSLGSPCHGRFLNI
jgi:hypothetical protein